MGIVRTRNQRLTVKSPIIRLLYTETFTEYMHVWHSKILWKSYTGARGGRWVIFVSRNKYSLKYLKLINNMSKLVWYSAVNFTVLGILMHKFTPQFNSNYTTLTLIINCAEVYPQLLFMIACHYRKHTKTRWTCCVITTVIMYSNIIYENILQL